MIIFFHTYILLLLLNFMQYFLKILVHRVIISNINILIINRLIFQFKSLE
ncbi:Hypothetical protein MCYN_0450 [Mycoplasmopsis cynos C142]|uniref:Uncharacterized protein n=1 Tax=Mycoplasmopsis cynos (strain C142) TaxID=1246955 RepID=L0RVP4_MYCC1|nr:Hypothetical protein MCYN_0450 [Mycoplasmopsis cynos C142]